MKAFVLIETAGKVNEVVAKIRQLEGVKSIDLITRPYDAIAVIEKANLNEIGDLVTGKIQPIVSRLVTCLVLEEATKR